MFTMKYKHVTISAKEHSGGVVTMGFYVGEDPSRFDAFSSTGYFTNAVEAMRFVVEVVQTVLAEFPDAKVLRCICDRQRSKVYARIAKCHGVMVAIQHEEDDYGYIMDFTL